MATVTLQSLADQIAAANADLARWEARLAEAVRSRVDCKRTIGWNNGCLDTKTAESNEASANIASAKARIADLQRQYDALAKTTSQLNQTNPEFLKGQAQVTEAEAKGKAEVLKAQSEASSKMWIVVGGVLVVLIVGGIFAYIKLKK